MTPAASFLLSVLVSGAQLPAAPAAGGERSPAPQDAGGVQAAAEPAGDPPPPAAAREADGRSLRIGGGSFWTGGVRGGWTLGSATEIGEGRSPLLRSGARSSALPLFHGEWAWTGTVSRPLGRRTTVAFAAGVAHYDAPPPMVSRDLDGAAPFSRVVAPLSQGHPATIWEARARVEHRLIGDRRQLRLFVEGLFASPLGTFRETELSDGPAPRPASTGSLFKAGAAVTF
jgi:hypothetical protein